MKVSRYKWPQDKRERLAIIQANLTVEIPERYWGRRGKAQKEEVEEQEGESDDEQT